MNIVVIVRPAPGWEKPRFNLETGDPEIPAGTAVGLSAWGEGTWVLNATDRAALDVALALHEAAGGAGGLTALALAAHDAEAATDVLYEALARGTTRAILVTDPDLAADHGVAATALAAAVRTLALEAPVDLALCGAEAPDGSPDALAPMLAAALEWGQATGATGAVAAESDLLHIQQRWDGATRTVALRLPAVVSVERGGRGPARYTLGAGVMTAYRRHTVETWDRARLGLDAAPELPAPGVTIRRNALADASAGERLAGPVEESVAVLIQGLKGQGLI